MTISNDELLFLIVLSPNVERYLKEKDIDNIEDRMHNMLSIRLYNLQKKGQVALWVDNDITLLLKKQQCYFLCVFISKHPKPPAPQSFYHELPRTKPRIVAKKSICDYQRYAADCDKINREVMGKKGWSPFAGTESMLKKWKSYLKLHDKELEDKCFHLPARECNIDVSGTSETIHVSVTGNADDVIKKIKASQKERLGFMLKMPHGSPDDDSRGIKKKIFGEMKNSHDQSMKIEMDERINQSVREEIQDGIERGKFFSPEQNVKGKTVPGQQEVNMGAFVERSANCSVSTKSAEVKFENTPDARCVHFYYDNEMKVPAFSCLASRFSSGWCITPDSIKLCNFMIYADYVSDIYQSIVMKRSLDKITSCDILEVLAGERVSRLPKAVDNIEWTKNRRLDEDQKNAVKKALGAQELCLIWGPPGTGKTEVIAEIARQQSIRGKKTLIVSHDNSAVDNALGRLYDVSSDNVFAFRIADGDYKLEDDDKEKIPTQRNCGRFFLEYLYARIEAQEPGASPVVVELRQKMLKRLKSTIKSFSRVEHEMEQKASVAGSIREERERAQREQMMKLYQKRISVAGSTLMRAGKMRKDGETRKNEIRQQMNMKEDEKFDTVIIDEVSKALPTELVIPILLGKSIVLVGDHKQLPPTLEMRDGDHLSLKEWAKKSGIPEEELDTDHMLFEELWNRHRKTASSAQMLTKQYRMHPEIQEIIQCFYTKKEGIDATLECGLTEKEIAEMTVTRNGPLANTHAAWVDTNKNTNESKEGTSFFNNDEIRIVGSLLKLLPDDSGLSVGVITFYGAQRDILKNKYQSEFAKKFPKGLIFDTVDRFQGRECDVVLCSLVRKNNNKNIGFAEKPNRINVAFSRARRLLCIIGNSGHFCFEASAKEREIYYKIFRQCKPLREGDIVHALSGENS